ncbi:DNA-binding protein [Propionivibrio sp.]|uniref:DNA-binding protein n=1 Tax=Propionivibrio sp. TaxID=2212460 RepID=UPI003BF1BDC9
MYNQFMHTVIETLEFQQQSAGIWTDAQFHAFINWIAQNPLAGDVIPGACGARKVRWSARGQGKRGGARIIYFHLPEQGVVLLIAAYVKAERSTMTTKEIRKASHEH